MVTKHNTMAILVMGAGRELGDFVLQLWPVVEAALEWLVAHRCRTPKWVLMSRYHYLKGLAPNVGSGWVVAAVRTAVFIVLKAVVPAGRWVKPIIPQPFIRAAPPLVTYRYNPPTLELVLRVRKGQMLQIPLSYHTNDLEFVERWMAGEMEAGVSLLSVGRVRVPLRKVEPPVTFDPFGDGEEG